MLSSRSEASIVLELRRLGETKFSFAFCFFDASNPDCIGIWLVSHLIQKVLDVETFIEVNCSQLTDELISSELFGHIKGAFTGANESKVGLLEKANDGIIFLDEIHALSIRCQKTLLKAIEEKEFYPVGSNKKIKGFK